MVNLRLQPFYNSAKDNILKDFYIPVLSESTFYKRVSAYFDSNIISMYSRGIENIVKRNGHIYFIFSNEINEKDYNIIKNSYEEREKYAEGLNSRIYTDNPSIELINLGYLIKNKFVDIKIAFTRSTGIFHDKFGLFENGENSVYFRGSNNETVASIQSNFESFETTCSWDSNESEISKINNAKNVFDQLWNDTFSDDVIVMDMPEVLINQLISYSKDKLIYNNENHDNAVIIDYKKHVIFKNNLLDKRYLSPEINFYKRSLELYVHEAIGNSLHLKKNISYVRVKKIISELREYALKRNFSVFLTDSMIKYFEDKDIMIDKRRSLGISIKERMSVLHNDFTEFSNVVNSEMTRRLREPQMWDAYHISKMIRSANFSVPGSGKTSIVYGAFAYLQKVGEVDRIVMVGPINSFSSWIDEFKLCFGDKKELRVFDYQKEKEVSSIERFNKIAFEATSHNLILFNYESVQSNVDALTNLINSRTMIVFDEVHRIKSITGIRASSAKKIGVNAKYRAVLTGTPIPNGYIDLFNMFNILFTDEYDTFFDFDENYLIRAKDNLSNQNSINDAIYPFFCRTNKEDLKVPKAEPDNIIDGYTIVSDIEEELFEIIYRAFSHNILTLYIRLIQASNNPKLILKGVEEEERSLFNNEDFSNEFTLLEFSQKNFMTESDIDFIERLDMTSKFYKGIELVSSLVENGKVLVWGIFIDTINKIKGDLVKKGINAEVITGSTSLENRETIINEFKNGSLQVLITNPHTLGESVSLHKNCHQAVYFEYSFNLVHMLQSRDRIHRLGLDENQKTTYYYMVLDSPNNIFSPIDMKIYNRLIDKANLQSKVLEKKSIDYIEEDIKEDLRILFGDL